ncbi:hypothetical protein [uncultured Jannaschia sp.]|uniref:DUF6998 domain-containing protein n=1 Tax=uncultured Jannaschia sp. TaxID=293347 RepID=UPI00261E5F9D|nr:hypothetical protein [uncultured Jannaschia sp.]
MPQAELRHLTGRIGELYAAMITRGQMALAINQKGYDIVSADGERISVKTITTSTHVAFNPETFDQVDRVIVLRLVVEENEVSIEELLDRPAAEVLSELRESGGRLIYSPGTRRQGRDLSELKVTSAAKYKNIEIRQFENGTILVERDGVPDNPAKPTLRSVANDIGVDVLNANGNPKNTRTLGADILTVLTARFE